MTTSSVTPAGTSPSVSSTAGSASSATSSNPLSGINFLTLLTAQLQNQDPMDPVDDSEFTTQLAELSTVSGINQLNTNFTQMLSLQQLTQGADLIGQTVIYTTTSGSAPQQGVVTAANIVNGSLQLTVGGNAVPLSQVSSVIQPASN